MCTRALRPPQAASPLARMRTAPASPRAPRFHLAVNRTPTRLRPTRGHAIAGGVGTQEDAFGKLWCEYLLLSSPRCVAALQISALAARFLPCRPCRVAEARDKVFGTTSVAKDFLDCDPVKTGISAIPDLGLGSGHGHGGGADGGEEAGPFWVAGLISLPW
jgi:hypothetical protein